MRLNPHRYALVPLLAMLGCGGSDPGNSPTSDLSNCTTAVSNPITLSVDSSAVYNVNATGGCFTLPSQASGTSEYALMAYSGYYLTSDQGASAAYALQSANTPSASASAQFAQDFGIPGVLGASVRTPAQFERKLRLLERGIASSPLLKLGAKTRPLLMSAPNVGDKDSFYVCKDADCDTFVRVGATVRYVGSPGVIYVDDHNLNGAEALTDQDFAYLGGLFNQSLYPTDTTAFGRESDINNDQHIAILITPGVNNLTTDCSDGRIIGYTFGNDLVPSSPSSNAREMFYMMSTSPATSKCNAVTRASALNELPSTLIHELQHMISFNQHVLVRNGFDQVLWANEGLSHFAEELGWRNTVDAQCPDASSCFSIFMSGDLENAYDYLNDTESEYLIAPEGGGGTLAQRGAAWLFLRWAADHFSADSIMGTQFTRGMEFSTTLGGDRVAQLTGVDFATLMGQWHLATYTSGLPGFPTSGILTYRSLNLRSIFAANYPNIFDKPYPLTPDSTFAAYTHFGTLRGGSGRMVRFKVLPGTAGLTLRLAGTTSGGSINSGILPYISVVRLQ